MDSPLTSKIQPTQMDSNVRSAQRSSLLRASLREIHPDTYCCCHATCGCHTSAAIDAVDCKRAAKVRSGKQNGLLATNAEAALIFLQCQEYTKWSPRTCGVELFHGIEGCAGAGRRCWGRCLPLCTERCKSRPHPRQAKARSGHDQWHRKIPRRATKEQAVERNSHPMIETRKPSANEYISRANEATESAVIRRSYTMTGESSAGSAGYICFASADS